MFLACMDHIPGREKRGLMVSFTGMEKEILDAERKREMLCMQEILRDHFCLNDCRAASLGIILKPSIRFYSSETCIGLKN